MPGESARDRRKRIVGHNIRHFREAHSWLQEDLADAIGAHRTQIVRWEGGTWEPSPEHLEQLAKALGIEVHDFYRAVDVAATA